MGLYGAIDLHSNNSVLVVLDERDQVLYEKRLPNDLGRVLEVLLPYRDQLVGVVVESTFNWYWLVDGLMAAGYRVHLANTTAIQQYKGLKYTDDAHDARWLAKMLRLGILPEGYIYPKEARAVRDLLRRRAQLVRQRTTNLLSMINQFARLTGCGVSVRRLKQLSEAQIDEWVSDPNVASALRANLAVIRVLDKEIERLEGEILRQAKIAAQFSPLLSIPGVGEILALTIMLETGDVGRFAKVGQFSSYARCVDSKRISNGKKKGEGNVKCGNPYLAWAFGEAAALAVRFNPRIKRFFERKRSKASAPLAYKAVAHKLARAAYHVMRERVPYEERRAFG